MKVKTNELIGPALDWAVAKCEGYTPINHSRLANVMVERINLRGVMNVEHIHSLGYSTKWDLGGPIITQMIVDGLWLQSHPQYPEKFLATMDHYDTKFYASTPLISAMRCYVFSKLGNEVEIPEELV